MEPVLSRQKTVPAPVDTPMSRHGLSPSMGKPSSRTGIERRTREVQTVAPDVRSTRAMNELPTVTSDGPPAASTRSIRHSTLCGATLIRRSTATPSRWADSGSVTSTVPVGPPASSRSPWSNTTAAVCPAIGHDAQPVAGGST